MARLRLTADTLGPHARLKQGIQYPRQHCTPAGFVDTIHPSIS
jgi:hypothetical protein